MTNDNEKQLFIDKWFPIKEVSFESVRERKTFTALPPMYALHIWFARRPLATSRSAILGSILPNSSDAKQFLNIMGIPSGKNFDSIVQRIELAKSQKKNVLGIITWDRAFTHTPNQAELDWLSRETESLWNTNQLVILDPMAGGGSIPFEAARLGLKVIAGDLNPVSFVCLKATVEYPLKFRMKLVSAVDEFCSKVQAAATRELGDFYPRLSDEKIHAYLWARTVRCQHCGLVIPISPNWWLLCEGKATDVAAMPKVSRKGDTCSFEIVTNPKKHGFDPDIGTDTGKDVICPRPGCSFLNLSTYIKAEAQSGRLGHQLYAICLKKASGRKTAWSFRTPTDVEIEAFEHASNTLSKKIVKWEQDGLLPSESFPQDNSDTRPLEYGMKRWADFYNPRQLLAHMTYLEILLESKKELFRNLEAGSPEWELAEAIVTYAALVFDTCVDYNCLLSLWHFRRLVVAHMMGLQGFPFKSSYAEWDHSRMLWKWATSKILRALKEIIGLLPERANSVNIYLGDAASIPIPEKSIHCIVVDPPYQENVMYADLMGFFYPWQRRILKDVFPSVFRSESIDKREEAVANAALFRGLKNVHALANQQYQSKMEACFRDMARVLRDDGILTVMFTHRKAEAWAALAKSLINAEFTFSASWPVLTEPGEKFGKREKGVLKVTVLLVCRKRATIKKGLWEEAQKELYDEAERKVREHSSMGIGGPDLLVSVYGPVLGKFANYSSVKDAEGATKTPQDALEIVAEVVNKFVTADIGKADFETLSYLNLLRSFPGLEVDTDLARVASVFGGNVSLEILDVKGGKGLVEKKGGKTRVLLARERLDRGLITPNKPETLTTLIDIVHASLIDYNKLGIQAVKKLLKETSKDESDSGFVNVLRAIAHLGANDHVAKELVDEGRIANVLLEALGHEPETILQNGESLSHYID